MKKVVIAIIVTLGATSIWLFVKVHSLPATDVYVLNELSIVGPLNESIYGRLKGEGRTHRDHARRSTNPYIQESLKRVDRLMVMADSVHGWFEEAQSAPQATKQLSERLQRLPGFLKMQPGHTAGLNGLASEALHKFELKESSPAAVARLELKYFENYLYELMTAYADSLLAVAEGATVSFGLLQGRPQGITTGLIAFNPPAALDLGQTDRLQVRISKNLREEILKGMSDASDGKVDSLLVGDVMVVKLSGDGFEIVAYDEEEQGVLDDGFTQWEFDITPKSSGTQALYLKIGLMYSVPGIGPAKKFLPVYSKEVRVHVNAWKVLSSFASERWEFLISTFLIPGIAWGFSRIRRRVQGPR